MTDAPMPQAWLGLQMKKKSPKKLPVNTTRNRTTNKKIRTTLSLGKTGLTNTGIPVVLNNDRSKLHANKKKVYEDVSMRTKKLTFTEQNGDNEYENL